MRIRKLFKFENAHIVRNCSSDRCKYSIHGHSYQIELILEAHRLDYGQMVYDFGLLKSSIKDMIDSFDHAICFWDKDDLEYIEACKKFSARWISLPVSPSAVRKYTGLSSGFLVETRAKQNNCNEISAAQAGPLHHPATELCPASRSATKPDDG